MQDISLRPMQESDLDDVARLYVRVYEIANVGESWTYENAYKFMKYCFNKRPDLALVACEESKIIAGFTADIRPFCDGNVLVDGEIFVDPDCQKHGIGKELSKLMYKNALEKYQIVKVEFITFTSRTFPLAWYKKIGFSVESDLTLISADPKEVLKRICNN